MTIVDDETPDALTAAGDPGRFHLLIIVEDVDTGDGRRFVEGSLTWRDLPLPLMADDKNRMEHLESTLVGNIDTIERIGTEIHGYGSWLSNPQGDAARLIDLIERRELRGVSADIDDVEFEVLYPIEPPPEEPVDGEEPPAGIEPAPTDDDGDVPLDEDVPEPPAFPTETDEDGQMWEVLPMMEPRLRVTEGRIMGATVVPFPAFQEAFIEPETPDAEPAADPAAEPALSDVAASVMAAAFVTGGVLPVSLVAGAATGRSALAAREAYPDRFTFPDLPPAAWYEVPETPGPMPLTILDSGQVFGHLAVWGECHVGIAGECVEPPPSASNYARFHVGETPLDDGTRIATGRLTFATGHAASNLGPDATRAHYDDTGTVAADIVAHDGEYGIWVCGAVRSTLTTAQVREVLASPPSGDWRRFGRDLELVGALCVNVPGFNTPRLALAASAALATRPYAKVRREAGMVASLIVSHPAPAEPSPSTHPDWTDEVAARVIDRIALSIGRDRKSRIAALAARVHGGK